jgi:uncharacterized protein YndB with AHSA1/START domain
MMAQTSNVDSSLTRELVITRVFDAPRSLVFKAWTQPEHMMRWWGPKGYTTPTCEMDVRAGGALQLCMRSSEGTDIWVRGVFREVVEPERLVFTAIDNGEIGSETVIAVTFEDLDGKTRLTMHQTFIKAETSRGAKEGWNSSLDRLEEFLSAVR